MRPLPVVVLGTFQSTSPVRGTTKIHCVNQIGRTISIHVPREGDDTRSTRCTRYFNPRPP